MPWITVIHSHHEARLVKVVGVFILDAILCLCVLYQLEPASNNLRVPAESPLVIVLLIELDLELRSALNKGCSPVLVNRVTMSHSE
jgi:hypothetical protein